MVGFLATVDVVASIVNSSVAENGRETEMLLLLLVGEIAVKLLRGGTTLVVEGGRLAAVLLATCTAVVVGRVSVETAAVR